MLLTLVVAPLGLPLVLAGMHLALWRFARQPPPLFQRERPVAPSARLLTGLLGLALCYLVCVVVAFAALRVAPSENSLTLDPVSDGPAARAGVRRGDVARAVDGRRVSTFDEFTAGIRRGGDSVALQLEREGQPVRLVVAKDPSGKIGVYSRRTVPPAGQAARNALTLPARYMAVTLGALFEMIRGSEGPNLQGPVGIARSMASQDDSFLPLLLALLSYGLPKLALAYLIVLVIDAFARRRYQRSLA